MQRLRPLHLRSEPVAPTLRITTSPRPAVGPAPQQPNLVVRRSPQRVLAKRASNHEDAPGSPPLLELPALATPDSHCWGRRSLRRSIPGSKQTRGRGSSGGSGRATVGPRNIIDFDARLQGVCGVNSPPLTGFEHHGAMYSQFPMRSLLYKPPDENASNSGHAHYETVVGTRPAQQLTFEHLPTVRSASCPPPPRGSYLNGMFQLGVQPNQS